MRGFENGRYILDTEGNPVPEPDLMKWGEWMQKNGRHIANDFLPNDIHVSTVFLGLDHGWQGELSLYETMIFGGNNDQYQERYATKDEALAGHQRALQLAVAPKGEDSQP